MKKLTLLTLSYLIVFVSFAQRGKDGAKVVNATEVVNAFTFLTADVNAGDTLLSVTNSSLNANFPGNLSQGDLIMIYQVQGVSIEDTLLTNWWDYGNSSKFFSSWGRITNYNNCGNYEFAQVEAVPNGTTIDIDCPLQNSYTASGRVLIIRVPRYLSLTINNGGVLTTNQWNENTGGGVLAIEVMGVTTINAGGLMDVSGLGFRGGEAVNGSQSSLFGGQRFADANIREGARKGEGIAGDSTIYATFNDGGGEFCRGAAANAGGGGNAHNAGGGGGGNAGNINNWNGGIGNPDVSSANYITAWSLDTSYAPNPTLISSSGGGRGGYAILRNNANELQAGPDSTIWGSGNRNSNGGRGGRPLDYSTGKIFMGGAGGAGEGDNGDQTDGGNGGGLIFMCTYGDITGAGNINANGANGIDVDPGSAGFGQLEGVDGAGGAGAGGTVLLKTTGTVSLAGAINANGGQGGNQVLVAGLFASIDEAEGPGGGGGGGYIAVSAGAPTRSTTGGINGVTNSPFVANFPPNGATMGGDGINNATINSFEFTVADDSICENTTATLTVNYTGTPPVGAQAEWFDAEFGGSLLFTGNSFTTPSLTANTTYWVRVCPAPYLIPVLVQVTPCPTGPIASFSSSDSTLCIGDCIDFNDLSSGTPNNWSWHFFGAATTTSSSQNPTNICYNTAGSFNVALVVSDGVNSDSLFMPNFITVSPLPTVTASNDTAICLGDTAFISVTGTATNYSWDNSLGNGTSFAVTPTLTTNYHVTGTDANGCSNIDSVLVTINPLPTVTASNDTAICMGDTAFISVTGTATTYNWDNALGNGTNFAVTPTTNTMYHVVGTDGNSCTNTDSILVTINPLPNVIASNDTSICSGDQANLSATGATTYLWDNGLGMGQNQTPSPISNTTYIVTGTDGNGCTNIDSVMVTVTNCGNPPVASFSATDSTLCIGDCIDFTDLSTNVPSGWTWYFFGAATSSSSNQNPTNICYNTAGTFDVALVASNGFGQDSLFMANFITVSALPTVVASNDTTICAGSQANLSAVGAVSYNWDNGLGAGQVQTPSPLVTTTYRVTGTDANGCVNTDSVLVTVNPSPTVTASNDTAICVGDTAFISVTGTAATYTWDNSLGNGQNFNVIPTSTTTYYVVGDDGIGCTTTDSITVTVNALPNVLASNDTTICSGDQANISASGATSYLWNNSLGAGQSHSPSPTSNTTYIVTGTDGNGCVNVDSVMVTVTSCNVPPVANFSSSGTSLCINDCIDFTDLSTGGIVTGWNWYFEGGIPATSNIQNPTGICYNTAGTYGVALTVTNTFGQDSMYVAGYITVDSCNVIPTTLTIPNVFSPNGDGENDLFKPEGTNITSLHMEVYNRWGELLYKTDFLNAGWDGRTTSAALCPDGTYFYIIEVNGEIYKGSLTLIR